MIMFPNILLNGSGNYKSSNGVSAANTSATNSSPSGTSNNNSNNNTFSTPAVPSLLLPPPIPPMPASSTSFYSSSPTNLALLRHQQQQQSKKPISLAHFSPASQPSTSNNPATVDSASQFFYKNLMTNNNPSMLNAAPTALTSLHGLDQSTQSSLFVNSYFNNYLLAVLSQATASNIANSTIVKVCLSLFFN